MLLKEQQAVAAERAERDAAGGTGSGEGGGEGSGDGGGANGGAGATGARAGGRAPGASSETDRSGRAGQAQEDRSTGAGRAGQDRGDGRSVQHPEGTPAGDGGAVPADVGDGRDDDVVARQLREAAMSEKDPAIRDKLWDEYRRYKKGGGSAN